MKQVRLTTIKVIGIIFLFILSLIGCTEEDDQFHIDNSSSMMDELHMKSLVDGDSLLLSFSRISNKVYSDEILMSETMIVGITNNATKMYEVSMSVLESLFPNSTFRIEIELIGTGDGSISLYQSLTGGGPTTQKLESNTTSKEFVEEKKSLFFSLARLDPNAGKVYVMYNHKPTTGPVNLLTFMIRIYMNSNVFSFQKWTDLRDYIHFRQGDNPTIGGTACGHNTYMMARHMVKPDIFAVNSSTINHLHGRLNTITEYTNFAYLHYLEGLANGRLYNLGGYQEGICSTLRRGDLGRENIVEDQHDINDYHPWSQLKTTSNTEIGRNNIKQFIEQSLSDGKYIIIPIQINNDDVIVTSGGFGHFVLIVGIDKTADGVGSLVYYKDGLTANAETRRVDYTTLLDSNLSNTTNFLYPTLSITWYKPACW